nr:Hpt domain-containing protein [Kordiimonas laminariae]
MDIFVQNAPGYLVELSQASVDDWSALAHKLKGAARGIGAWRLARASERAELMENSMLTEEISSGVCASLNVRMEELLAYIAELPKDEDGLLI